MPIYESKQAIVCTVPALALTMPPSLAGILDDLEGQIGVEKMKTTIVNIMQQSSKAFLLHLATADQVAEIMAQGLTFRGHLLEMAPAKNTTTVIVERVPYGLPEVALSGVLSRYGEVKSIRPVTHKGYGLSKYKIDMARKQDIPRHISVQGNPVNVFYKSQPRSCFVCQGTGHEAKTCPWKVANKRTAPVAQGGPPQVPVPKRAHQGGAVLDKAPPIPQLVVQAIMHPAPIDAPALSNQVLDSVLEDPLRETSTKTSTEPARPAEKHHQPCTSESVLPPAEKAVDPPAVSQVNTAVTMETETTVIETSTSESPPTGATAIPISSASDNAPPDKSSSAVPPTSDPDIDQYFQVTPPTVLHPRPELSLSDSSQETPSPNTRRTTCSFKTKPTAIPYKAAGMRKKTLLSLPSSTRLSTLAAAVQLSNSFEPLMSQDPDEHS